MKLRRREYLRERVYSYYKKFKHFGKKFTIDHFISEGELKSTIYNIINRFESRKPSKHQQGGGRPSKIFNQKAKKKLKRLVNNKDGVSQRKLASRFKCTQQHVSKLIKAFGIKNYKKQNTRIEISCWMMNVISQKVGPTLIEMTFFTQITKI